uniref:Uncharacterized protein n=1 Tax=Romanomermis culicivorax TaxID=13658 RepID=A0A915L9D6_ROMCU
MNVSKKRLSQLGNITNGIFETMRNKICPDEKQSRLLIIG